jgi:beta-glucosidase
MVPVNSSRLAVHSSRLPVDGLRFAVGGLRSSIPICTVRTLVALILLFVLGGSARAESVDDRVEKILSQMTVEEKIDYIGGVHAMSIRAVPRLDLPEIRMSDGPLGVRQDTPSTRYPAGICLAASWDRSLAGREGVSMGRDSRARGINILLAPGVNINRVPFCGRNFEYISGEDPYLASQLVVPFIRGVQSQGVAATVKHFAVNNQEFNRLSINAVVGERALREIYLPAFESAVEAGGVAAVMDAYNKVNGYHCTENEILNLRILKGEWKFDGLLMSDWEATHSALGPVRNGLDLEMPSGQWMNRKNLPPALKNGTIRESVIDEKVRRILRLIVRMGFLDRIQRDPTIPENDPSSAQTALEIARDGIVLLKNEKQLLPLDRTKVKKVAVLGPDAHPGVESGWGSSFVAPFYAVSVLDGLREKAGANMQIEYFGVGVGNAGTSEFEHEESTGKFEPGLKAQYFNNLKLGGEPIATRVDWHIKFNWVVPNGAPIVLPSKFTARWTGVIRPKTSSVHVFRARADSGIRVFLDGKLIIDDWSDHAARPDIATRRLDAGKTYDLRVEYRNSGGGGALTEFGWASLDVPDAVHECDAAVVVAGFDEGSEGEGSDRTFELPDSQDDLISKVAEKNPNTVVILNSGGNVDMHRWIGQIRGLIHAWYPGQEGGTALAEILFGDVNPSGKLPVTFERQKQDNPAFKSYPSQDGGRSVHYDEGIFVGYRGYDRGAIAPLFPFGFGLSYSEFQYSNLRVEPARPDGNVRVNFMVRNSGQRAGAEVAQVYVGQTAPSVERPVRELKGFEKLALEPGETKEASVILDERAFAYFDLKGGHWRVDPGEFEISVGASSRDLRLKMSITK